MRGAVRGGRCEELCGKGGAESRAGRLPRPRVGRTAAACAGKGVWGRDRSLVCVGAPCQPAEDRGRLHPCVQHWEASIEASVTARDFLNPAQERDLRVPELLCAELPGSVSALELLLCAVLLLRWGSGRRAEPRAAQGSGSDAGLCPSITELLTSVFCFLRTSLLHSSVRLARALGANRGSPALVEEHRQERERFPWKPLDAQQQVLTAAM